MKSLFMVTLLSSVACHAIAQWNPNNQTTGNIYYNGGNVGIGTSSPAFTLDVIGNLRTTSFASVREYLTVDNGGSYRVALNAQSDGYITARNSSGTEKFTITTNGNSYFNGGNVGFLNAFPLGTIHVNTVRPVIIKNNGGNGIYGSEIGFNSVLNTSVIPNQFKKLGGTGQNGGASIAVDYSGNMLFQMYDGATENETIVSYLPQKVFKNNGRVGIGTTSPNEILHVKGRMYLEGTESYSTGWQKTFLNWKGHSLIMGAPEGTYGHSQIELKSGGSTSGRLDTYFSMFTTPSPNVYEEKIHLSTAGNSYFNAGNIGIGTTNPDAKLAVKGTVHAEEVKVDLQVPGPDYVFEPTYQLPSLTEIENYIKANKHLPEVPSAKEMERNGINLSEMNMLLLKKVEELTLYLIEMQKISIEQQKQLTDQRKEIESLKSKVK